MKCSIEKIQAYLKQNNAPRFIWLNSKEPVLLDEARSSLKTELTKLGYTSNGLYFIDSSFDWLALKNSVSHADLFVTNHYQEYLATSGKLSKTQGEALFNAINLLSESQFFILVTPAIDKATQKTKWFTTLEEKALIVTLYPLKQNELLPWLMQHVSKLQLGLDKSACLKILSLCAGNLIAAKQILQRLSLQVEQDKAVSQAILEAELQDESRFDVFDLSQAFLTADRNTQLRTLYRLKQSDAEPILILWALVRDIRLLAQISSLSRNDQKQQAKLFAQNQIWVEKQADYLRLASQHPSSHWHRLLLQAFEIDKYLKGLVKGNPWQALEALLSG